MNVYDFDQTIYDGDSSLDFFLFYLKRHPLLLGQLIIQLTAVLCIKIRVVSTKRGKEWFFSFLKIYPPSLQDLHAFWAQNKHKITSWYLEQQRSDDLIVSASPLFLLEPFITVHLQKKLLATEMDIYSGKITGKNCKGQEKVQRFLTSFPHDRIDTFYSDSLSDTPLAKIAQNACLVKNDGNAHASFHPWPY